jgi:hypothetical protein
MSMSKLVLVAAVAVAPACGTVSESRDVTCDSTADKFLPNGSFDNATPAWKQETTSAVTPAPSLLCGKPGITPADGTESACMGGMDGQTQTLSQTVFLPEGAKTATLSGQICITTQETDKTVPNDTLKFELLDGTKVIATLASFSNEDGVDACQFTAFVPDAVALTSDPAQATLRIRSTLNTQNTTSFFIDVLSLDVICSN